MHEQNALRIGPLDREQTFIVSRKTIRRVEAHGTSAAPVRHVKRIEHNVGASVGRHIHALGRHSLAFHHQRGSS